jgi:hypothetical protein
VADSLDLKQGQRVPDNVRAGCFPGMCDHMKSGIPGTLKGGGKELRRVADFIPSESKGDDSGIISGINHPIDSLIHRAWSRRRVANAVGDPAKFNSVAFEHGRSRQVHGCEGIRDRDIAAAMMRFRIEVDFCVSDMLACQLIPIGFDGRTQVICRSQTVGAHRKGVDEVREVRVVKQAGDVVNGRYSEVDAMPLSKAPQRLWPHRAFKVNVEFNLGHGDQPFGNRDLVME